jgi:hypothetical protein
MERLNRFTLESTVCDFPPSGLIGMWYGPNHCSSWVRIPAFSVPMKMLASRSSRQWFLRKRMICRMASPASRYQRHHETGLNRIASEVAVHHKTVSRIIDAAEERRQQHLVAV